MAAIYHLENVRKIYGRRTILDIDELSVYPGEILSIIGPSGSGKSTLLRLLNFLERPDRGKITFDNKEMLNGSISLEDRRRITTVFQHPALMDATVRTNIGFGLKIRGKADSKINIDEWLVRIGMEALANARATTLSAGEAQRVALARAVVLQPDVLLLDEPTANLDPYNVLIIENAIRIVAQQQNTTIILVTHNIFQAKRLAQRVGLLLGGKIIEINETAKIFDDPQEPRTAAFLEGKMVW